MPKTGNFTELARALSQACGAACAPAPARSVAGGSINECYRWESDAGALFVKVAPAERLSMFEAEAAGLAELASAGAVRAPAVRALGVVQPGGTPAAAAFLALEWIDAAAPTDASAGVLGEQLAWLHRVSAAKFGWHRDNTIGSTPQINTPSADWVEFFRERRLRFQLALLKENAQLSDERTRSRLLERGAQLLASIGAFFTSYRPVPSLLHGDLWGGNWLTDVDGAPVLFDPAVYYGDREADLAMTRLFGGFPARFYSAYVATWPLDQAQGVRRNLYNLYHLLNHANLFGGGYLNQSLQSVDLLLSELGS